MENIRSHLENRRRFQARIGTLLTPHAFVRARARFISRAAAEEVSCMDVVVFALTTRAKAFMAAEGAA